MSVRVRRWFTANLVHLLHRAGSPSYRVLARFTEKDTAGPDSPFEVALRVGVHPRSLPHSTIHELVTGRRESVPDGWVVSMFVIACACWGARHGSPLLPNLSSGSVQGLLREWQQRRADYEDLLRTPELTDVAAPGVRVGVVPLLADRFQARRIALELEGGAVTEPGTVVLPPALRATAESETTVAGRTTVLAGTGGVGKTQLAADFATRAWHDPAVRLAVWATADSRTSIITAYAEAAHRLLGADLTNPDAAARRLLEWVGSTDQRWLVVLDDLHRPADLRDLWPTTGQAGQVVVTTRRRDPVLHRADRIVLPVDVFTPTESLSYLQAKLTATGTGPDLDEGAAELADALGHLPLALAQAAAYQLDRGLTCRRYLDRFLNRSQTLVEVLPDPNQDELPDGYRHTIATTWSLSIDLADRFIPQGSASLLLRIAALLDPAGTPLPVFTTDPIMAHLANTTGHDVDEDSVTDTLGVLHRLSLITLDRTQTARAVAMHALVQRAVRDTLTPDHLHRLVHTAADALFAAWPDIDTTDTGLAHALRSGTSALHTHSTPALWKPAGHVILFRAGRSLTEAGQTAAALGYWSTLHDEAITHLGANHPNVLRIRHSLAYARSRAGDPARAAIEAEALLIDLLRVLGPEHRDTLTTRHNLAQWRGEAGDPARAITDIEALLTDQLRILGPDHPHTLTTRASLARWHGQAGSPPQAAHEIQSLLADQLRILGPNHPSTLNTRHDIAFWRSVAGDPARAIADTKALLTDQLRVLGPDHPNTLNTRASLARWHGAAGDPARAIVEIEALLTDQLRILGPDHPSMLEIRHELAYWRNEAGDSARAIADIEALLTDQLRILGPDHPSTLTIRYHLASWCGAAGDPARAVAEFETLLADRLRILGADHLETRRTRSRIAHWQRLAEQHNTDNES